jgi:plastocyanin
MTEGGIDMKKLIALPALAATLVASAALLATTATAAAPVAGSVVNVTVNPGSLKYTASHWTAKAGLVQINFTNNSTASHNVSLEHNGEFEFGASVTIKKSSVSTFLTLAKGTYHVYSSVGTDEDKGMAGTLVVS